MQGHNELFRPILLLDKDENEQLVINPDARDILINLPNKPIIVIAIIGPARTGKSYLLNRLAEEQRGFSIGATVTPCTHGIWIWGKPHPHADATVILLDTEGLGDPLPGTVRRTANSEKYDQALFLLSILLSSYLIHNNVGTLNNDALKQLHYASELAENLRVHGASTEEDEFARQFPPLLFLLRDYALRMELDGRPVTPAEYLERCLAPKRGVSRNAMQENTLRLPIRTYFVERDLAVLPRPVGQEEDLRRIEELPYEAIRPEFRDAMRELIRKIFSSARPKCGVDGQPLTSGRMFLTMLESYVGAINIGAIPDMEPAWEAAQRAQNRHAHELAVQRLHELTEPIMQRFAEEPASAMVESNAFHRMLEGPLKQARVVFFDHAFNGPLRESEALPQYTEAAQQRVGALESLYRTTGERHCRAMLDSYYEQVTQKMIRGEFYPPQGSLEEFDAHVESIHTAYMEQAKGPFKRDILQEFIASKKADRERLIATSDQLSQEQKRTELESARARQAEIEREAAAERAREIEQRRLEQAEQHRLELLEAQRRSEEQNERRLREQEERMERASQQREEAMRKGLEAESAKWTMVIEELRAARLEASKHQEEDRKRFEVQLADQRKKTQELQAKLNELQRKQKHSPCRVM